MFGDIEISDLGFTVVEEYICWFDISMDDIGLM
jgi:hypothetical protein